MQIAPRTVTDPTAVVMRDTVRVVVDCAPAANSAEDAAHDDDWPWLFTGWPSGVVGVCLGTPTGSCGGEGEERELRPERKLEIPGQIAKSAKALGPGESETGSRFWPSSPEPSARLHDDVVRAR